LTSLFKILTQNQITEQVSYFNYLQYKVWKVMCMWGAADYIYQNCQRNEGIKQTTQIIHRKLHA